MLKKEELSKKFLKIYNLISQNLYLYICSKTKFPFMQDYNTWQKYTTLSNNIKISSFIYIVCCIIIFPISRAADTAWCLTPPTSTCFTLCDCQASEVALRRSSLHRVTLWRTTFWQWDCRKLLGKKSQLKYWLKQTKRPKNLLFFWLNGHNDLLNRPH